jgi:hypothetical protein
MEMPGFFPDRLIRVLDERCPPDRVHTVVLWSKHPAPILERGDLARCLKRYGQVFLHLTVTGMGGSWLEPGIPTDEETLGRLPALVDFLGGPERLTVRFDPIVRLRLPGGRVFTNRPYFSRVAEAAGRSGVERLVVSWMQSYPKVVRRLERFGVSVEEPSREGREEETRGLFAEAGRLGLKVSACCDARLPVSSCIDGRLLSALHPAGEAAPLKKAGGQRPRCGCTASWDIGWYDACPGGCLYCYANPRVRLGPGRREPD